MAGHPHSRLDAARRRIATARRVLTVGSTAAFGAALLWAHASHPGTAATVPAQGTGNGPVGLDQPATGESFDFGAGSLAPSTSVLPDVSSHAS